MSSVMRLSLRAGEKLYLNGAVLRLDRKASIELLNDATFLLEAHVMQPEDATTPLRQVYFIVQAMLMDPGEADMARSLFEAGYPRLMRSFENPAVLEGLEAVRSLIDGGRAFEALKKIRTLFPFEDRILEQGSGKLRVA